MANVSIAEIRQMMKEGDLEEAQGHLAQMLIDNPKDEAAWLLLSDVVPTDQAKDCLQRVLEINPDNHEARLRLDKLNNPPPEEEPASVEAVAIESEAEQEPQTLDNEDYNLDDLIKSLEEKSEILPDAEPESLQTTPGTMLNEEDSFLAALLEESPPEPAMVDESEPVAVDDGSFFALPIEEEAPAEAVEEPGAQSVPEEMTGDGAVPIETLPEEMAQLASQEFPVAEESIPEEKKPPKPPKKSRRKRGLVSTILIILVSICVLSSGIFVWYYFYGPCGVENVIKADEEITDILGRWDDSMMVATNSSRIVLAEPLRRLVDIRQELNRLEIPVCMGTARESLDRSMLYTLEAYDKLFKYESDAEITKRFNMAKTQRKLFEQQLDAVRQCAPLFCP